jgi:hypothetical protein
MADPRKYVTKRVHFFDHQFLRVAEFADEQAYHIARLRDHNRGFHTAGVVEGLEVKFSDTPPGNFADVANGWATDTDGREIVLGEARKRIDLTPGAGDADIWISYNVTPGDPSTDPGVTGTPTRDHDDPVITVTKNGTAPPPGAPVRLARVKGTTIDTDVTSRQEAELLNDSVLSQHIKPADNIKTPSGATSQALKSGAGVKTGHIADDAVTTAKIADDAVTVDQIADNAVTSDQIAANAVGTTEIATDAVTADEIAANAVGTSEIATDAVTTDEIADDAVTTDQIADDAVTTDQIADGAVTDDQIAADAVTTTKILDANVTLAKLAPDAIGGAVVAFCEFDGTGNNGWGETGNHHNLANAAKRWVWVLPPIGPPIKIPMTGRYGFEWSVPASTTVTAFAYDAQNQKPLMVKLAGPPKATGVEVQVTDAADTPQDGVVTIIALATTGEP